MCYKIVLAFICSICLIGATHHSIFDTSFLDVSDLTKEFDGLENLEDDSESLTPIAEQEVRAVAVMRGFGNTVGLIHLVQSGNGVTHIYGTISGLRSFGAHGFHVHENAVTSDCESAGAHYNPTGQSHGGPESVKRHVGDLGNVNADANGVAKVDIDDDQISLVGRHSVIRRSLVVHIYKDDLGYGLNRESRRTGNSGGRLACGTIRFVHIKKQQ